MNDRYIYKAKRKNNGEWVEGYYIKDEKDTSKAYIGYLFGVIDGCVHDTDIVEVYPSTVCQCTGLPDKDKTPMYENDVVRASGGVHGVIRFGKYGDMKTDYGFYIEWDKTQPYWRNDICYWQKDIGVIGSYIDNPELLEDGTK